MTRHFDYCPSASEGDNQSVMSSAPVVSRCFPGGYNVKLYISRGRLAWWLLAFLHSAVYSKRFHCKWYFSVTNTKCLKPDKRVAISWINAHNCFTHVVNSLIYDAFVWIILKQQTRVESFEIILYTIPELQILLTHIYANSQRQVSMDYNTEFNSEVKLSFTVH